MLEAIGWEDPHSQVCRPDRRPQSQSDPSFRGNRSSGTCLGVASEGLTERDSDRIEAQRS